MERLAGACQQVRLDQGLRAGFGARSDRAARDEESERIRNAPRRADVSYPSYLALAALLTLVTAGVVYVARSAPRPAPSPATTRVAERDARAGADACPRPSARPTLRLRRSANSISNARSSSCWASPTRIRSARGEADWAYERGLATNLLSDTRLYRQAAEARGMRTLAGVMGDLEIVLLQTSLAEAPDADALGQIQRLIHKRDLVTKMDVTAAGSSGS